MTERKTYRGVCHCGAVAWEADIALSEVAACNCSRCSKLGWLLTFIPAADFRLKSGEGKLKDYLFNKRAIHHLFCTECGIESFARGAGPDGKEMVAVNVRCLEGVDPGALPVRHVDGASL